MAFRTKLDYSDNRQINQRQRTFTNLEGGTVFGVTYSAMTTGVDPTCSAVTEDYVFTGSTFSGNGITTIYTWFDPRMEVAAYTLSALTSSNSGETQSTGNVFVVDTTATTVDGYNYTVTYTGTSFDLSVDSMYSGAGPVFTGTVTHDVIEFLSACSLDYTGTTCWIDNPEKTKTKKLVITENATPNYVWTCLDVDGNGGWFENSSGGTSGGTDVFVTGSSWNGPILTLNRNDGGTVISAYPELWTAGTANNTAALIGYAGLTNDPDAAYFDNGVTDMISGSTFSGNTINMNDGLNSPLTISHNDQFGGTEFLKLDSTILLQRNTSNYLSITNGTPSLRGNSSVTIFTPQKSFKLDNTFGLISSMQVSSGFASMHAFKSNTSTGSISNNNLHLGGIQSEISFGIPQSGTFSYDGVFGSGLGSSTTGNTGKEFYPVFISAPRCEARDDTTFETITNGVFMGGSDHTTYTGTTNFAFVGGSGNTINTALSNVVVLGGVNITATSGDTVYVPDLVIDGFGAVTDLQTNSDGRIIDGASDITLKNNIESINGSLDKILKLNPVSFEWTPSMKLKEGKIFGLIAQEVQEVIPEIVRERAKGNGTLTLEYKELIPWVIGAIQELASDDSPLFKREELIIKTQTIASEDNNIELNFGGTHSSALNGGITVIKGKDDNTNSNFEINSNGDWVTNNYIIPHGLVLPEFTPSSTNDEIGKEGEITRDNNHIYIKTQSGWKRTRLETF